MRRLVALAAIAVAALALSGCEGAGQPVGGSLGGHVSTEQIDTPAGTVTCLIYRGANAGGLDCNWPTPTN